MAYVTLKIKLYFVESPYFIYPARLYTMNEHLLLQMDYVVLLKSWQETFESMNQQQFQGRFNVIDGNERYVLYQRAAPKKL